MTKKLNFVSKFYVILILIFLYLPIVISVIFSFNSSKNRSIFTGFSLTWYELLLKNSEIHAAFFNSVMIGIIAAFFSTFLGTLIAFAVLRLRRNLKKFMLFITNFSMMSPEIIQGTLLMTLFVSIYKAFGVFQPGFLTLALAHITFCLPYVVLNILPKLQENGETLYEAAVDLGCMPMKAIFKGVLPEILPSIMSTSAMTFTLSLSDFTVSYFTCGNVVTLPILIFSMTRKLVSPEINAVSTLMFFCILMITIFVSANGKKVKTNHQR